MPDRGWQAAATIWCRAVLAGDQKHVRMCNATLINDATIEAAQARLLRLDEAAAMITSVRLTVRYRFYRSSATANAVIVI